MKPIELIPWTKEEDELLLKLWPIKTAAEVHKAIPQHTITAIRTRANRRNIVKQPTAWSLLIHKKDIILRLVKEGKHANEIAEIIHCNAVHLQRWCKDNGIQLPRTSQQQSGIDGERKARQYMIKLGWNIAPCETNATYDFIRDDGLKINVKNSSITTISINETSLRNSEVGTLYLCVVEDDIYYLRLEKKDKMGGK